jgi:hypothetical protein
MASRTNGTQSGGFWVFQRTGLQNLRLIDITNYDVMAPRQSKAATLKDLAGSSPITLWSRIFLDIHGVPVRTYSGNKVLVGSSPITLCSS